ncbi:hypothetical protein DM860_013983 [Cuscuta australis]|uniref:Uncharacterized protein n=1 Tax=Cuscuta australis TaxID=267555 RepID=A0A328DRW0_9ASTE|nr:hypothetical protein DM860_013983 [Cuscuta australis]
MDGVLFERQAPKIRSTTSQREILPLHERGRTTNIPMNTSVGDENHMNPSVQQAVAGRLANCPSEVYPEEWKWLVSYWDSEKFRLQAKKADSDECDEENLSETEEVEEEPYYMALWEITKKQKNGTWSDEYAEKADDDLKALHQEKLDKYGEDNLTPQEAFEIVLKHKKGSNHQRGMGQEVLSFHSYVKKDITKVLEQERIDTELNKRVSEINETYEARHQVIHLNMFISLPRSIAPSNDTRVACGFPAISGVVTLEVLCEHLELFSVWLPLKLYSDCLAISGVEAGISRHIRHGSVYALKTLNIFNIYCPYGRVCHSRYGYDHRRSGLFLAAQIVLVIAGGPWRREDSRHCCLDLSSLLPKPVAGTEVVAGASWFAGVRWVRPAAAGCWIRIRGRRICWAKLDTPELDGRRKSPLPSPLCLTREETGWASARICSRRHHGRRRWFGQRPSSSPVSSRAVNRRRGRRC